MARPSVIPGIKARLEEFLVAKESEYLSQPEGSRKPTLPTTPDGKVNVSAVAEAINLTKTQVKYLHEREELKELINCIAEGQGVLTVGSRLHQSAADKMIKERLIQQAKSSQEASQAAIEASAAQQELLDRIGELEVELEKVNSENVRLRAQLDVVQQGLLVEME